MANRTTNKRLAAALRTTPAAALRKMSSVALLLENLKAVGKALDSCPDGVEYRDHLTAELGSYKTRDNKIHRVTMHSPLTADKASKAYSMVLSRVSLSAGIQSMLDADTRKRWGDLKRLVSQSAASDSIQACEDDLLDYIDRRCEAMREDMRRHRYTVDALPAEDQALYYLGSALAALQRQILISYAVPTLPSILPVTRYNTHLLTWTDFYEVEHTTPSEPAASNGGSVGSGGHPERAMITGPLRHLKQDWYLEQVDIDRHNDARGREGAPTWDLMARLMEINTAQLMVDRARLVAFGSDPQDGVVPFVPNSMKPPGFLYSSAPVAVDFNTNNGETNYTNLRNFVLGQRQKAMWTEGLTANVMTLSPSSYFNLKGQFINSGGGDLNVIDALLANTEGLDKILVAREYEVIPGELDHLNQQGYSLAPYLAGGVRDALTDTQREAITLHRDNPDIVSQQEGFDLEITDSAYNNGLFAGTVKTSNGGTRVAQPAGVEVGMQAA